MSLALHPTQERWLTLKEAAEALAEDHGLHTTAGTLRKLTERGMPSAKNFGKRQVKVSVILPWLKKNGLIEA